MRYSFLDCNASSRQCNYVLSSFQSPIRLAFGIFSHFNFVGEESETNTNIAETSHFEVQWTVDVAKNVSGFYAFLGLQHCCQMLGKESPLSNDPFRSIIYEYASG